MAKSKDNGFHVKLDGINFSEESRKRIQAGIQEVLLKELAGYFPNPDDDDKAKVKFGNGVIIVPPRWWYGFIIRQILPNEVDNIQGLQQEINSSQYGG